MPEKLDYLKVVDYVSLSSNQALKQSSFISIIP